METPVCEVHGTRLKNLKVPVRYGLPAFDPASVVAGLLFPHANSYTLGGCIVDVEEVSHSLPVCRDCRVAEKAWRAENGEPIQYSRHPSIFERSK